MISSLDGLRAIAVLAVMLFHSGAPLFGAGWIGVDLFFVLSGFLITTLLLGEQARFGHINLRLFWARRFLRLMPVYVLYISGVTLAMLAGPSVNLTEHGGWTPAMYIMSLWTYLSNLPPQGGNWTEQHLTRHLWSLSVEEQFYFLWPVALLLLARTRHLAIFAWIFTGVIALNNLLAWGDSPPKLLLYTRGIGLAIGCSIAITLHRHAATLDRLRVLSNPGATIAAILATLSFAGLTYGAVVSAMGESELLRIGVPAFDLSVGLLIANLWRAPDSRLSQALSQWPLPQIGAISYGAYLYHMLVWDATWHFLLVSIDHWPRVPKFGLRLVVFLALTIALSILSHRLIERPFLRFKDRLRPKYGP